MRKGFTLIELLIVIAILAILSTLGIGNFQSARIKARDLSKKSDLQTIAKSLEAYVNDHRSYPQSDGLTGQIICQSDPTPTNCSWGASFTDDKGTIYAATLPEPPSGTYWYQSSGTSYTLSTQLENDRDSAIIESFNCGQATCNYQVKSSNLP